MIDGHTHLEYGPLSIEYVEQFIYKAKERGLLTLHILDHTHRFIECKPMYESLRKYEIQDKWLSNNNSKFIDSIDDFITLKNKIQSKDYGIRVLFGLEVCYTPKNKELIRTILSPYKFDFLVGAIHSIDDILYDMPFSKELLWDIYPVNYIYERYYDCVFNLIDSKSFTQLAHPDTIKLFQLYPTFDLSAIYHILAIKLKESNMLAENNTGCYYRYHHPDMGLSQELLHILKEHKVEIITCSDAHKPDDVASYIKEIT